jgi:beta-lactamase class A
MPLKPRAHRRGVLAGAAALAIVGRVGAAETKARPGLAELELATGGRLGVFARDAASGRTLAHRPNERFPMCSTFKAFLAAAILARCDAGTMGLSERLTYGATDLLPYAPQTRAHLSDGAMSIEDLCAAAVEESDNTAANLLLARLGGPEPLTAWLRRLGDDVTRLDRNEPSLNTAIPGDPRDTTTPKAMTETLDGLLYGAALSAGSRERLLAWMLACRTGDTRLKAGVPAGWRVADKTGTGMNGTSNDVAVLLPGQVNAERIVVAAFLTESAISADAQDHILAQVGAYVAEAFAHG